MPFSHRAKTNAPSNNEQNNGYVITIPPEPNSKTRAISILEKAGLLINDNAQTYRDLVAAHLNPDPMAKALSILYAIGLLTGEAAQTNAKTLIKLESIPSFADTLLILQQTELFADDVTQANFDKLITHPDPDSIKRAIYVLEHTTLLSGEMAQENFESLTEHQNLDPLTDVFFILVQAELLDDDKAQNNFDTLSHHQNIEELMDCLRILQQNQLMNEEAAQHYFDVIAKYPYASIMASSIGLLESAQLLSDDNAEAYLDAVIEHERPYGAASAIFALHNAKLLTEEHLNIVINLPNPAPFAEAISLLQGAQLLEGDNFNRLIPHISILFDEDSSDLWFDIPAHVLTPAKFDAIITLCETHQDDAEAGQLAFSNFVHQELLLPEQAEPAINDEQSTHTASVHASVSASAQALMSRYQDAISTDDSLDKIIHDILDWLDDVEENPKAAAAKRCIPELICNGNFEFQDPVSKVTIKQLVALSWLAIHDDSLRAGTLNDGKFSLLDGLYQIQREYNISAKGIDDDQPKDLQACPPGAFNKLIEKLVGIHQDIVVRFITHGTASMKFTAVVKDAVISYLTELPQPEGRDEIAERIDMLDRLSDESMGIDEDFWEMIVDSVGSQIQEEFGSLYNDDQNHPKFIALMEQWPYVSITKHDLRHVWAELQAPAVMTLSSINVFFQPEPVVDDKSDSENILNHQAM